VLCKQCEKEEATWGGWHQVKGMAKVHSMGAGERIRQRPENGEEEGPVWDLWAPKKKGMV